MKTSLEWLSPYLPGPLTAEQAGEALTHGGLPVELVTTVESVPGVFDTVIDVEVTSNRSDCLSVVGVARELAALLDRPFVEPPVPAEDALGATGDAVLSSIAIDAVDLCPHYTARAIKGVRVGPSPDWMQRRLRAIGLRPVNNVVDVTNYVLFELGQPLHAFDLGRLRGGRIVVRQAVAGETLVTLDGKTHALQPGMLVIADGERPVALAGVMGGRDTEVTDGTVDVLLESARFDPLSIRTTARALSLGSDSSYRYERGIDPTLAERASRRAAELIVQTAGGTIVGPLMSAGASGHAPRHPWLRLTRMAQLLGVEFPVGQVVAALQRLNMQPVLRREQIDVTVPSYRLDVNAEVDLIEEAARVIGYDKIPVRDQIEIRVTAADPAQRATSLVRDTLTGAGYFEALTLSFVTDALAEPFTPPGAGGLPRVDGRVRSADARLRPSLLPGLLEAVRHNETVGNLGVRLFEIGATFWLDAAGAVQERRRLALVGGADYRAVRGVVEAVLAKLDVGRTVTVTPADYPGYAAGACGTVSWGDAVIGHLGKVARPVADGLSLRELPVVAELDVEPLLAGAQHVPQLRALPRYPAVRRDLSLVLPEATRFEQLAGVVRDVNPDGLEAVEYVTTYRGMPLDAGTKSVTVTLVFRSPTATLTGDAVEAAVGRVVDAAKASLGATLRV